ncbi:MAG: OadG family transporter subunit [Oscillospiraceae bacterium]
MNIMLSMLAESSGANVIDRLQGYAGTADSSIAQQQLADPDYWSSVGIIALTGILVVFLILAILIMFFYALGAIFKAIDKKKAKAAPVKQVVAPAPAPVIEEIEDEDEEELIAVISAAIAAYAENDGTSYTIRSIKRKGDRTRSAWSMAGISANMRQF